MADDPQQPQPEEQPSNPTPDDTGGQGVSDDELEALADQLEGGDPPPAVSDEPREPADGNATAGPDSVAADTPAEAPETVDPASEAAPTGAEVAASAAPEAEAAAEPASGEVSNGITQEELDALTAQLQGDAAGKAADNPAPVTNEVDPRLAEAMASTGPDNSISQEELDQLTQSAGLGEAEPAASPKSPSPVSNLIDQSELDALAQQVTDASRSEGAPASQATQPPAEIAEDDLAAEMAAAIAAEAAGQAAQADQPDASDEPSVIGSKVAVAPEDALPLDVPVFGGDGEGGVATAIDLLDDVELDVKIELGRTQMYIEDVLQLGEGSVVELDKLAGDPVDIFVNERLVARGEVLVLNDNFCVRINDIISPTVADPE